MNFFPDTPDEQVMYSTVLILSTLRNGTQSTATGFIYTYIFEDKQVPVIVTNKHVANSTVKTLHLKFHTGDYNSRTIYNEKYNINYDNPYIIEHSELDLSIIPIAPILTKAQEDKKSIFYIGLKKENVIQKEALEDLTAFEDLLMVGYPRGLYDQYNYLPLFRTGKTASHPYFDFNSLGVGLSDISVYEGSSGSPIFIYNLGTYYSKKSKRTNIGGRIILLGINSSVYTAKTKGILEIVKSSIETIQPIYDEKLGLGVYIKAYHLNDFEDKIVKMLSNK